MEMAAMKMIFRTISAGAFLIPSWAALGDTPVMKTNSFADVFNQTARNNNVDKTATLEKCRSGLFPGCLYKISERTKVLVAGKPEDTPKSLTVITVRKGEQISGLFSAEDETVWPLIVQILNPEQPPEQRKVPADKFEAMMQAAQSSFTTKIGANRYSVAAAPDMGIWMIANIKASTSTSDTTWIIKWRRRIEGWIKK